MRLDMLYANYGELSFWTYEQLQATFWRLYLVSHSGAYITYQGRRLALKTDEIVLIPANTPFASELLKPVAKLYLHFRLIDPENDAVPKPILLKLNQRDQHMAEELRRKLRQAPSNQQTTLLAMAWISDVLTRISSDGWVNRQRHPIINRLIHHLEHLCSHPPDVPTMAAIAGMSTRHWQRLCRQETGMSPREFARSIRLSTVANQLVHSSDSLEKIASDNGFCDRYHLTRVFTRFHQESPAAYRRNRQ